MTSLPPSRLIAPPSKLIVTVFASEGGGSFLRWEIVPPSKLIVNKESPQGGGSYQGGFLIKG